MKMMTAKYWDKMGIWLAENINIMGTGTTWEQCRLKTGTKWECGWLERGKNRDCD